MKDVSLDPVLCFQLLQLPLTASVTEIKAAYRIRARQCHPDQNRNDPKATEKFSILHQAYQGALHHAKTQPPRSPAQATAQPREASRPGHSRFRPPAGMHKFSSQQRCTRARKAYLTALGCLKHLQDDLAWPLLQEALWLNPENVAIRYKLEDVALYTGRLRELESFLQAIDRDRPQVAPPTSRPSPPLITPPPPAKTLPESPESSELPSSPEPEWQVAVTTPIASQTLSLENLAVPGSSASEMPGDRRPLGHPPQRTAKQQEDTAEILILPSLLQALNSLLHHPSATATARALRNDPWQALLLLALGGLCGSLLTVLVHRTSASSSSTMAMPVATALSPTHQSSPIAD